MQTFILILEIIGTIAFAASGAMTALKKDMDLFGVIILGLTTAVGGGFCCPYARRALQMELTARQRMRIFPYFSD